MFSPAELTAILLGLKVAAVATLCSLPFAIGVAWLLARRRFFGHTLLDALVHLPLVLPPVVNTWVSAWPSAGAARRWRAR